jgi:hypothetical protein
VDVAIALGTIGAVLVALFGQAFRAKFFPPKLSLQLTDRNGEATRKSIGEGPLTQPARYYHIQVSNARRWSPARDVRIVLLQVEEPGPDGERIKHAVEFLLRSINAPVFLRKFVLSLLILRLLGFRSVSFVETIPIPGREALLLAHIRRGRGVAIFLMDKIAQRQER